MLKFHSLFILLLTLIACATVTQATDIRVSAFQTPASYHQTTTPASLRIYSNTTFTDSNGKLVTAGQGRYLSVSCSISGNVMTCAEFVLASTTDSSRATSASYTGVLYDSRESQKETLFTGWQVPTSLGMSVTFEQLETYNVARPRAPGPVFYNNERFKSIMASAISGAQEPKMTDTIFGIAILFEAAVDVNTPTVIGPNSLYVNSMRTQAIASLPSASVREGTLTKLTDSFRGQVYDNGITFTRANLGVYNVTDFGAKDDNSFDNTVKIQDAIDAASAAGGGVVRFSASGHGTYRISGPLVYKQGVVLEGETGTVPAKVRLYLTASNTNAITVGENLVSVHIRNLELFAASQTGTKGILFTGAFPNSTQLIAIENVAINGFDRGISVEATDPTRNWQASNARAIGVVLHNVNYGFYLDAFNSDWEITDLTVYGAANSYGIYVMNSGSLHITHANFAGPAGAGAVCTAGVPNPAFSDTSIQINGPHGVITVDGGSQNEGYRKTLVNNYEDPTYPIIFEGVVMGASIELNQDVHFHITGSSFYDNTISAAGDSRVYANGNFVDPRNTCLDPGTGLGGISTSGNARIVWRTAQFGIDSQTPVAFGSARPDSSDTSLASTPIVRVGDAVGDKVLLRIGQTNASRAFLNYYDIKRDGTTGFFSIVGNQAIPARGFSINGPIELAGTSSVTTSPAGRARINYNATSGLLQFFVNGGIATNFIGATTPLTANRLTRITSDGIVANSLFSDNGTNGQLVSGLFQFHGATSSFPALKRNGTSLEVRCADDSAYCSFAALNAVFSGTVTAAGAVKSTAGVSSFSKGGNVASAASIVPTSNLFHVTGSTTITSVNSTGIQAGTEITIIFDGVLILVDGSNLRLAGNFVTTANDTITLKFDGTSWFETSRSAN